MHDRTRTVTHALARSKRAAEGAKGKERASPDDDDDDNDNERGQLRWKAGVAPGQAARRLFPKPNFAQRAYRRFFIKRDLKYGREWTSQELDEAAARGNFPHRPSDLFLKMYSDVLTCLTRDPLAGNVSPSLIGTQGTIPLSIVSTIPDIMQHYHDCSALASRQTCADGFSRSCRPSDSVKKVAEGLVELNKRVGERKGQRIVVKVMWDRGAVQQLWHNHVSVKPETWAPLGLPHPKDVPNLSLQVINFHRPLLGTFHQKAMVVDRKVALLNSNNIQDRPNLEMMVHLEGPVVDSIYDNMLISWDESLSPTFPCLTEPSPTSHPSLFPYLFTDSNPYLANIDVAKAARAARILLSQQADEAKKGEQTALALGMSSMMGEGHRGHPHGAEGQASAALRAVTGENGESLADSGFDGGSKRSEDRTVVNGESSGATSNGVRAATASGSEDAGPGSQAALAVQTNGLHPASSATSDPNPPGFDDPDAPKPTGATLKHAPPPKITPDGASDLPTSSSSRNNGTASSARLRALSKALNAGAINQIDAAIQDEKLIHDFKPHMLHRAHDPSPICLVNRRPHGSPGHNDIRCPQAAAWLAALKYAEKNVFIQTPTLNAAPIVRGVVEACSHGGKDGKGIPVTLFLGLGFNDKGESIPFQGGTNEEVVFRLFGQLRKVGKEGNLHVYWYTGKDQIRPLNAIHKSRNCHIKFMSVDGQCAIVGNGNLDSQSFWHSQEANILVDNPQLVADWMDQLRTNQSTHKYGRVDTDGIWRDPTTGEELEKPKSIGCFTAMRAVI
ncbi:hypothetical protein DMC30DRAFT_345314 [Rhodotorula diobovata]|uniref:PLD phosphodiesterase domain-containing protein n=1 Tax=Rhodotorula diobovata TaxID=5288 RepID=A0A5C5G898_9BASI|nr:hypothetical protein DMC30DRAFT_345314 [Rhodotorula diobovata]